MKMGVNPTVLVFFYGQLWGGPLSAETKQRSSSLIPATFQAPTTVRMGPTTQPFGDSSPTSEHSAPVPTATPMVTTAQGHKLHDGHLIGAVLVGIILMTMIAAIVCIFLRKRLRRRSGPGDPHWAGRSPFADGDVLEIAADKEAVQSSKRASVLSLLPWKLNKNTLLLENAEGQPSEPGQNRDDPSVDSSAGKRDSQSSPTVTENSASSSTSLQTAISDGPGSLTDIPLQSNGDLLPEAGDLPPPPGWTGDISQGLCPNSPSSLPPRSPAEAPCLAPPDVSCKDPGEASLLPPPPEEFF